MQITKLGRVICSALLITAMSNIAWAESLLTQKGYQLEEVVVLSRHNIRSPLTSSGSFAAEATPYKWFQWTAPKGHLAVHGALAETSMGIYFRKYLEDDNFMPEDWVPEEEQVRFYANSYQRTIATARYFSSGMLPVANIDVERTLALDKKDPVFLPTYTPNAEVDELVLADMNAMYGGRGIAGIENEYSKYTASIEKILDFKDSQFAKDNNVAHLDTSDLNYSLNTNVETPLSFKGNVKNEMTVADTLVMQYYEVPDDVQAAWGNRAVTHEDWENVGKALALNGTIVWGNYYNALVQSRNMVKELKTELTDPQRKFSFLCGHDTNIGCTLTALQVQDYTLPETITPKTAIGSKLVIEKRLGQDGLEYVDVSMVYESDKQLRHTEELSLANPPKKYPLRFKTLTSNADGLYLYSDFLQLLDDTIAAADALDVDD